MNLADPMRSQDNINKMVSQKREYDLLLMDRVTDISVRKLPEKNVSSDNQPQTEKY